MAEGDRLHNETSEDVEVRCHARVSAGRVPSERCLHTCTLVSLEGARVVYLYGGRGKHGPLDDLHLLDLEGNLWSQPKVNGEKPAGRYAHTAVAHERSLYVFGGRSRGNATFNFSDDAERPGVFSDKQRGKRGADSEVTDEVLSFDTETFEWSEQSPSGSRPCARYKHGSCLVPERRGQARMLVFGGCDEEGAALNDLYFLDIGEMAWSAPEVSGTPPAPRYGHSVTLLPAQRKVVILGGSDGKVVPAATGSSSFDPEFPPHKTTKSLHPMSVHILDVDSLTCAHSPHGLPLIRVRGPQCLRGAAAPMWRALPRR